MSQVNELSELNKLNKLNEAHILWLCLHLYLAIVSIASNERWLLARPDIHIICMDDTVTVIL